MPPPIKPDLEDLLREFVVEQRKADTVGALQRILNAFTEHEKKDEDRHGELRVALRDQAEAQTLATARISSRVHALERDRDRLEKDVENVEKDVESTGRHLVLDLKDEVAVRRESAKYWRRAVFAAGVSVLLLLLGAAISWFVQGRLHPGPKTGFRTPPGAAACAPPGTPRPLAWPLAVPAPRKRA